MKQFNVKKFILATLILLPILLLADIVYDKIIGKLVFAETFAFKNLFFKIAAAIVGAYFYATYNSDETKQD